MRSRKINNSSSRRSVVATFTAVACIFCSAKAVHGAAFVHYHPSPPAVARRPAAVAATDTTWRSLLWSIPTTGFQSVAASLSHSSSTLLWKNNATVSTASSLDCRNSIEHDFDIPSPSNVQQLQQPQPRSLVTKREQAPPSPNFQVYCDLDGVLADFAHGVAQVFDDGEDDLFVTRSSQNIDALPRSVLWDRVQKADAFFERLPWCPGGRELWRALAPLRPHILTGVPSYCAKAPRAEKFAWCQRELAAASSHDGNNNSLVPTKFHHVDKAGRFRRHYPVDVVPDDPATTGRRHFWSRSAGTPADRSVTATPEWHCTVITCWSERKHHESGPNVVLIDDRWDLKAAWEAKGGIFVHHITGDVQHTLRQLHQHGILSHGDPPAAKHIRSQQERLWHDETVLQP